jgi:hypothetical protein
MMMNTGLMPIGSTFGTGFTFTDKNVRINQTYYHWLEDVDISSRTDLDSPVKAQAKR